MTQFQAVCFTA